MLFEWSGNGSVGANQKRQTGVDTPVESLCAQPGDKSSCFFLVQDWVLDMNMGEEAAEPSLA
ncbi:hypothetical protein FVER14953_20912 [Fusarium verticillioides]|nr:hypothetical protein FVER14953_20912 [Fusarium verticillioides]